MIRMVKKFQEQAAVDLKAAPKGRRVTRHPLVLGPALSLVILGLLPQPSRAENLLAKSSKVEASYDARLRLDYNYRTMGDEKDADLYSRWSGSGRDMGNGRVDVYASGWMRKDLDKPAFASFADDSFLSLEDLNGVSDNRLLQLYADVHDREKQLRVVAGRQYIEVADYLQLDGAQVMLFDEGKLGGRVFWGKPVSYYMPVSDDVAWGLSLVGRPWTGNRTRFTYTTYDSPDGNDANYFVDMQQEVNDAIRFRGQLSVLNDKFRMGSLDCFYIAPHGETDFYFGGSRWGEFDARTRFYSPLYDVLGTQDPYTYGYARLTQVLFSHVIISPGIACRFADGGLTSSIANQSYRDYDLTLTYEPVRAISASLSLDYWDMDGSDSFLGVSGDIRYRYGKLWEISIGSSYTKYTYNTYSDISYSVNGGQTYFTQDGTVAQETPDSYSYFLRAKWNISPHWVLRVQGDIENDSTASDLAYEGRASIEVRF
jgi:hypothetical protein